MTNNPTGAVTRAWLSPTVGLLWHHAGDEDLTTMHGYEPIAVAILPDDAAELTIIDEYSDPHLVETLHDRAVRKAHKHTHPTEPLDDLTADEQP